LLRVVFPKEVLTLESTPNVGEVCGLISIAKIFAIPPGDALSFRVWTGLHYHWRCVWQFLLPPLSTIGNCLIIFRVSPDQKRLFSFPSAEFGFFSQPLPSIMSDWILFLHLFNLRNEFF